MRCLNVRFLADVCSIAQFWDCNSMQFLAAKNAKEPQFATQMFAGECNGSDRPYQLRLRTMQYYAGKSALIPTPLCINCKFADV